MRHYDKTTRPVRNDSTPIAVHIAISLYHILDTVKLILLAFICFRFLTFSNQITVGVSAPRNRSAKWTWEHFSAAVVHGNNSVARCMRCIWWKDFNDKHSQLLHTCLLRKLARWKIWLIINLNVFNVPKWSVWKYRQTFQIIPKYRYEFC